MAALTEEQTLLQEQARTWASEEAPVAKFREVRDSGIDQAFDKSTWSAIGEMGWPGIVVPEAYGGADMGLLTFGVVAEELGRQLVASPLLASGLVAASALVRGGSEEQKQAWLPRIAEGTAVATLAVDEGPRHAPLATALAAESTGDGLRLRGRKVHVLEGVGADLFIVAVRTGGSPGEAAGISLVLVEAGAPGLAVQRVSAVDSRGYATLDFDGVEVPASALLGPSDGAATLLDDVLDRARAGVGAEMLGVALRSFEMTLDYLKNREQFGNVIGSFQALGHRAAAMFTDLETTRSCVEAALQALDAERDDAAELCSLSKAKVGATLHLVSNEMIQMHGGIGVTDEFDAGLYLKRARALEATYGNQAFHRDRFATLKGF